MIFEKSLIDLILSGKKTMTTRSKRQFRVGDITNLMANKDYSKISGKCIQFTKVCYKALKDFTEEDARKEGFQTLADFQKYWEKHIGEWKYDNGMYLHEFKLIDYNTEFFENRLCDQCGSCCMHLKNIIETTKEDIHLWVKECRADILQYLSGWGELEDPFLFLIDGERKEIENFFWEGTNREMWFDPETGGEIYLCPFLSINSKVKKFKCLIQGMKPTICKKYHCRPSKMLGIVKKTFEENLKEYQRERRLYPSVASAPNKLESGKQVY